jgi:FAD/FMN-containing dehydrogenase
MEGFRMQSTEHLLADSLRGEIIRPGNDRYADARCSRLVTGSPALVIVPADVHDVSTAVRFARDNGRPLAIRGGGHSFAGFSTTDTGIVLDLSRLDEVTIEDADHHVVRVGGGASWGRVCDTLAPAALAISSGDTRSVGVGGLTLSGGIGWKVRKYGLALDSLQAAQLVTADGTIMRVSAEENPDLFWALRGGGGNVGVVTAFEFVAHHTTDVHFGRLTFPAAEAATVLTGWAEYLRRAPRELSSIANLANPMTGGAGAPVELHVCWDGDDRAQAERGIAPLRALGTVLDDDVVRRPYATILEEGGTVPEGFRIDTRSGFVAPRQASVVLATLVKIAASGSSPFISIRALGGAVGDMADESTAYAHRSAELMFVTVAGGPTPVVEAGRTTRAAMWRDLEPHLCGAYANFLDTANSADVRAVYPPRTFRRLAAIKRRYDPSNLFALNHNVPPADIPEQVSA